MGHELEDGVFMSKVYVRHDPGTDYANGFVCPNDIAVLNGKESKQQC